VLPALAGYFFERKRILEARRYLLPIFLLTGLVVCACFGIAFLVSANPPPERAWIIPQYILFCGLGIMAYLWAVSLPRGANVQRIERWSFVAVLIFAVLITGTSLVKASQAYTTMQNFAAAWDQQDAMIRGQVAANQNAAIRIKPVPNIFGLEPITNTNWVNGCMAQYYNVSSITIEDSTANTN
jgi:hypothetical protein